MMFPTTMYLNVVTMNGETLVVDIRDDSVETLKQYIQNKRKMPIKYQTVMFKGQVLVEGFKLSDYNVHDKSTLFVSLNYNGWPPCNLKRLALEHILNKKICRNCYGRMSVNATRCRKVKCGRTTNLRPKKPFEY